MVIYYFSWFCGLARSFLSWFPWGSLMQLYLVEVWLAWKAQGGLTHVAGSWCWLLTGAPGSAPYGLFLSSTLEQLLWLLLPCGHPHDLPQSRVSLKFVESRGCDHGARTTWSQEGGDSDLNLSPCSLLMGFVNWGNLLFSPQASNFSSVKWFCTVCTQ